MTDSATFVCPNRFVYPLEFYQNTPFMRGIHNGKEALFIFDSGAQSLALNSRYLDTSLAEEGGGVMGVTGSSKSHFFPLGHLAFGAWEMSGIEAMASDLQHAEEEFGVAFQGILGFREIIHFDWMVDYKAKELHLWHRFPKANYEIEEKFRTTYQNHLPGIEVEIAGKKFHLLIDTGADILLFDVNKFSEISDELEGLGTVELGGSTPQLLEVQGGFLKGFRAGKLEFGKTEIKFGDLTHMQERFGPFDGIIGYYLLEKYRTVVSWNFKSLIFLKNES